MIIRAFRKSSIKDVAQRAGVSTTTVSVFVNGREDVCASETAERIRTAIAELNYTPNSLTRGLRLKTTRTIGVCLLHPIDPELRFGAQFFERLWRGIVLETDAISYSLLHYPQPVRTGSGIDAFLDGRVDGVLFHGAQDERHERVVRAGMPVVLLTRSLDLPDGCAAAYTDEREVVRLALDHLHSLGHRRIAHLAGPVGPRPDADSLRGRADIALQRLAAYTEQQKALGTFDPDLVGYADEWSDEEGKVAAAVAFWRALPEPPTAIVCANDSLAVATLEAATALGWSVPEALSIVGIDDSVEARDAAVPLTSVAIPVEEIGREGIRCLLRLIGGEPVEACRVALPVTQLVVRASTAARDDAAAPQRRNAA